MRLAVLAGGCSSEREVSLTSGRAVADVLAQEGYVAELLKVNEDNVSFAAELPSNVNQPELPVAETSESALVSMPHAAEAGILQHIRQLQMVFTTMHGTYGEDGVWQGVLELLGTPYVSASVKGSALAMDKLVSKRLFEQLQIPTPRYWVERPSRSCRAEVPSTITQLVAKPVAQGSSVGIAMVNNDEPGWAEVRRLTAEFGAMLVEERIYGRELTAGIIGHESEQVTLPLVEIRPRKRAFYDYTAKYTAGETEYICPAQVSAETVELVQRHASRIYFEFELSPYSRIDCILDNKGTPWFLEANTLPGFTSLSLIPQAAAKAGIKFGELVELLMLVALERWESKQGIGYGQS